MTRGSIAVVIPAHNARRFLRDALESVRMQTRRPEQLIVVDNGSSDGTADVARAWHEERGHGSGIQFVLLRQEDAGPSGARNTAIRAARADRIALLDADDLFLPHHLERLEQASVAVPEAVLWFADAEAFTAGGVTRASLLAGTPVATVPTAARGAVRLMTISAFTSLVGGNYIPVVTTMLDRAAALEVGLFDPRFRSAEDREFLLRLSLRGAFAYRADVLGRKREHDDNATHPSRALVWQREQIRVLLHTRARAAQLGLDAVQRAAVARALAEHVQAMQYTASLHGPRAYLGACLFLARHGVTAPLVRPRHVLRALLHARRGRALCIGLGLVAGSAGCAPEHAAPQPLDHLRLPVQGVLRRAGTSPFFSDGRRAILLVGSHTWNNFQDLGFTNPPPPFDYRAYLDSLVAWNHNFFRLYVWEQASYSAGTPHPYWISPLPYARAGPGVALDGLPKFDLGQWNESFFTRLRERVAAAGQRGIYVAIMLFNGWSVESKTRHVGNPWRGHPFNGANNINGVDADRNHDGEGHEAHTLTDSAVLALQARYVRKVIATVRDLDNVLFEISNESPAGSEAWQYWMIRLIQDEERGLPRRHPVGMTAQWPNGDNRVLAEGPADWLSPNGGLESPMPFAGDKVVIWDTDHLCGMCASVAWVWKSVLSGYNPILMDGWDGRATDIGYAPYDPRDPKWGLARRNLGYALTIANRVDLARFTPRPELASTGWCLSDTSAGTTRLLVFAPRRGVLSRARVQVDLSRVPASDTLRVTWVNLRDGSVHAGPPRAGGRRTSFGAPVRNAEALLILEQR